MEQQSYRTRVILGVMKLPVVALLAALAAQAAGSLQPVALRPLPLGTVKPRGWLKRQLSIQATGLSGHIDEFWPDLGPQSGWLGGKGENWERGPYYNDGLVPLAYLLEDVKLIAKANKWMDWTLRTQRPDGGLGPFRGQDWWPNMVMLKALTQYQEASGDPRVVPALERYFKYQAGLLAKIPLKEWAIYRWHDEVLSILWLYERNHDPALLDLARAIHQQGYDWRAHFANFAFRQKVAKPQINLSTHVVNNAMALKSSAVWWRLTGDPSDRDAAYHQLEQMDRYHLVPGGVHSGDEHYAGLDPSQGTELCAVVEGMFSFEQMLAIFGDPAFGDRLEKIAFNALPGTFTADMWGHQYDQQANQVMVSVHRRAWTDNGPDSNLFGLEPNYGCCTSNFHQGWPKFTSHLWMATPDDGLAAVAYAPSEVKTQVRGVAVTVTEETEYPFRNRIRLSLNPARALSFELRLRIPRWVAAASVTVNGKAQPGVVPGAFYKLERRWRTGDRVEISLPMRTCATRGYRGSLILSRGPLVYSLRMGEDWRKLREHGPAADWEVLPTTAWNYGLAVDAANPDRSVKVIEKPLGDVFFSPQAAPVEMRVKGRRIPSWTLENGSAGPLPESPVSSRGPAEELTLVPYGAAKLRVTAFPWLEGGR